jgi:hypothetical protein
MLLCDDVRPDPDHPSCTHIDCLMDYIVSLEEPPFPVLQEKICVYLAFSGCHGQGKGQIRVAYADSETEQLLFGSQAHVLDFTGRSPLELIGVTFRIKDCLFPQAGRYSVQFWYDNQMVEERPLRLRSSAERANP